MSYLNLMQHTSSPPLNTLNSVNVSLAVGCPHSQSILEDWTHHGFVKVEQAHHIKVSIGSSDDSQDTAGSIDRLLDMFVEFEGQCGLQCISLQV